ncbi:hypothetical protein CIB95_01820 [Lottiidibacillus patelloidae]|uniref:N-acetyltransferase domain-containing protein n=1 Tax=Lottiidibacillus patelloidae TaxID=2670334 RepID=A0A263BXN6_9BACI|nr:GNAT family N-acetyltransferase [Lottiidibacillus patelloidae]OZM58332.1 hypothetical protein CIB95_01820 [Lottiidibacillus patelloidae]
MIIRAMDKRDISQVQHVAEVAWNDTYKGILPQDFIDKFVAKAYSSANLEKRLEETIFLVSDNNGHIEGFISVTNEENAELAAIYLLPDYQGKGIGTQLLQEAINKLPKLVSMIVYVEKENGKGLNFYIAKGFQIEEEFNEELLGHKVSTVKLKKTIKK